MVEGIIGKGRIENFLSKFIVEFIALPSNYQGTRTLENMLYAVCQAHNIPAPAIITPKNTFMTMYNRAMYPETQDAEINRAVVTTCI